MSKEQIEEMARDICRVKQSCNDVCHPINSCRALKYAERFYNAGYRKRRLGEWHTVVDNKNDIVTECTACKKQFWFMKKGQLNIDRMPYCPNCGAKMKGGAE